MKMALVTACLGSLVAQEGHAQGYQRVPTCGTAGAPSGMSPGSQDANGNACVATSAAASTGNTGALMATTSSATVASLYRWILARHCIVLRIETTNDVSFFKHHRKVEHRQGPATRELAPVKKSIYRLICVRYCSVATAVISPTRPRWTTSPS